MSRTPTARAGLLLALEGIRGVDLAADLDVTPQAISFHLAGRSANTPADLLDAIARRGGPDLARQIAEAIDTERHRHRRTP